MTTYAGTITLFSRGTTTFHTYTAPEEGYHVNSHIIETAEQLTVIDTQLMLPYAEEVATLLRQIGKPVARIIISHNHPDHYAGLQVLTEAFPDAEVHALQSVRDYMTKWAQPTLDARRAAFGPVIAERAVQPGHTLEHGETVFPGLRVHVAEVADAEAHTSALITFPDARVLAANDLVAAPGYNVFFVHDNDNNAEHWIAVLESIAARTDIDTVLTGHGPSTDTRYAIAENIAWLRTAAGVRAGAATAEEYAEIVKAKYPSHRHPVWIDFSAQMLYGHINP